MSKKNNRTSSGLPGLVDVRTTRTAAGQACGVSIFTTHAALTFQLPAFATLFESPWQVMDTLESKIGALKHIVATQFVNTTDMDEGTRLTIMVAVASKKPDDMMTAAALVAGDVTDILTDIGLEPELWSKATFLTAIGQLDSSHSLTCDTSRLVREGTDGQEATVSFEINQSWDIDVECWDNLIVEVGEDVFCEVARLYRPFAHDKTTGRVAGVLTVWGSSVAEAETVADAVIAAAPTPVRLHIRRMFDRQIAGFITTQSVGGFGWEIPLDHLCPGVEMVKSIPATQNEFQEVNV